LGSKSKKDGGPSSYTPTKDEEVTLSYLGQVDHYVQAMGIGRLWSTNPLFLYEGQFAADGQPNGYGRYTDESATYTGYWNKGQPHGSGFYTLNKGSKDRFASTLCTSTANDKTVNTICGGISEGNGGWNKGKWEVSNGKNACVTVENVSTCQFVNSRYPYWSEANYKTIGSLEAESVMSIIPF